MKLLNYALQAFGYIDWDDFNRTIFKVWYIANTKILVTISISLGTFRELVKFSTGLDVLFWIAFIFLIIAEWITGIKVDMFKRGNKFKSRKFGRMLLKIGVYFSILQTLFTFSAQTKTIEFAGFEINPLEWLYFVVLVTIIFQLFVSWLENLGNLGYKEARGIAGIVLKKYDKWFEFDGTKDGDSFLNKPKTEEQ